MNSFKRSSKIPKTWIEFLNLVEHRGVAKDLLTKITLNSEDFESTRKEGSQKGITPPPPPQKKKGKASSVDLEESRKDPTFYLPP